MAIRAVLFDWGGTLVRGEQFALGVPVASVAGFLRQRVHIEIDRAAFERAFEVVMASPPGGVAPNIDSLLATALNSLGISAAASDVDACSRLFFDGATRTLALYEDARAALASLHYQGYRCAILADDIFPARLLQRKLNEFDITGYVDVLVSSADVGVAKPDASMFLRALSRLNLEPHEGLFVGDSVETDIAGARRINMRAVLLDRRQKRKEASGYLVIHQLSALNDLLGESGAR